MSATQPEAQGRHAKLQLVLQKALDRSQQAATALDMREFFPHLAPQQLALANELFQQLLSAIRANVEGEFEAVCLETHVESSLRQLEALLDPQSGTAAEPASAVDPAAVVRGRQYEEQLRERDALRAMLEEVQTENAALARTVIAGRDSLQGWQAGILQRAKLGDELSAAAGPGEEENNQ